jgi:hypothetical protein
MCGKSIEVEVDEALSETSGRSFLEVRIVEDGYIWGKFGFSRGADPQHISAFLNQQGCYVKYDERLGLSEEDKENLGNAYIDASCNVPGLKK